MVSEKKKEGIVDFDAVLEETGGIGRYQITTVLLLFIPPILIGATLEYIFTAAAVRHRCYIPECESQPVDTFAPDWLSDTIPGYPERLEQCSRFKVINSTVYEENKGVCPAWLFDRNTIIPCESYVYEQTNTIVFDFDLGCQEWKRASVGTYKNIGALFGLPLFGYLSDKIGRRSVMIIGLTFYGICGVIRAFSTSFEMYATLGFLEFLLGAGAYTSGFIIATEMLGSKYRHFAALLPKLGFAMGQALMGAIAWISPDWRTFTLTIYPPLLFAFVYHWLVNDSVRWLLTNGKFEEAGSILRTVGKKNHNELSEASLMGLIDTFNNKNDLGVKEVSKKVLIKQLLSSPIMRRRLFITPFWWVTLTLVYYGLSINSVNIAGNMYLNFILVALIEIPGDITGTFLLNYFGRRRTMITSSMGCAASLAVSTFASNQQWLVLLTFLVGKFFISMVMTSAYVYTADLYPTNHRHTLLAYSSSIGRLGAIMAPLTPALTVYWTGLPTTIFASVAFLSGCLAFFTPETLHCELPDTIEEAENLGRNVEKK